MLVHWGRVFFCSGYEWLLWDWQGVCARNKTSKLKCVQSGAEQSKASENRCYLQWDLVPNFCKLFCMSKSPTPLTGGSRDRCCARGCVWSCSCNCSANVQSAFVQLAASFGIKFMETSAKANINIENVSTSAFLLYLLSSLCKQAVWNSCPSWWDAELHCWVPQRGC